MTPEEKAAHKALTSMDSIWVVVCDNGRRCTQWLDRGFWENTAWNKEDAESHLMELDSPAATEWAKELNAKNPEAFAKCQAKGIFRMKECGPHKIVEYRPIDE